jgi:NADH dehydrogenase FAD-containing subunit
MNVLSAAKTRILILGGGFGGVYTARHPERLCKRRPDIEIVLVASLRASSPICHWTRRH